MTTAVASTKSASLAVQAQPQVAGFGRRAIAFAIDTMLVLVVLVLWMGVSDLLPLTGEDMYWIGFLIGFFFFITLPLFFAIALPVSFAASARVAGGRTLGKIVTGTAIRTDAGAAVGFGRVFKREWARGWLVVAFGIPAVVDHLAAVRDPQRRTWHDRAASTVVLRTEPRRFRDLQDAVVAVAVFALAFCVLVCGGVAAGVLIVYLAV